jgi:hypothetical protein
MTSLVWANFPGLLFVLAWAGISLGVVLGYPDTPADHSGAHAYLAAKAAPTGGPEVGLVPTMCPSSRSADGAAISRQHPRPPGEDGIIRRPITRPGI